jgi:hypothetical protein
MLCSYNWVLRQLRGIISGDQWGIDWYNRIFDSKDGYRVNQCRYNRVGYIKIYQEWIIYVTIKKLRLEIFSDSRKELYNFASSAAC